VLSSAMSRPSHKPILLVLALLAFAGALVFLLPHDEQWYRFHRLSYWVQRVDWAGADQERARNAIRRIGPKAIPFLFKRIRRLELQRLSAAAWSSLPAPLQDYVSPKILDASLPNRTAIALSLLGPAVIPQLLAATQDPSSDLQAVAVNAIGRMGSKADYVLPTLTNFLNHTNGEVRLNAVLAISQLGPVRTQAVPGLVVALNDSNLGPNGSRVFVREAAARSLGEIGPDGALAVPTLISLLGDPEQYLRHEAAIALWQITHDTNLIAQFATALENAPTAREYRTYLEVLAFIGPSAKASVPIILRPTSRFKTDLSRPILHALQRIDPDAVANYNRPAK